VDWRLSDRRGKRRLRLGCSRGRGERCNRVVVDQARRVSIISRTAELSRELDRKRRARVKR
jgi:predicted Fe-S protein YdhL (DUF1289 family)